MREFPLHLNKELTVGLKNSKDAYSLNTSGFDVLTNIRPSPQGLIQVPNDVEWDDQDIILGEYQALQVGSELFLFGRTDVKKLNQLGEFETVTLYAAYPGMSTTIPLSHDRWHFMNFDYTFLAFKSNCIIFRDNKSGMGTGILSDNLVQIWQANRNFMCETGCEFRGRGVFGGFTKEHLNTPEWQTWLENNPQTFTGMPYDFDNNFVAWTSIGGGDLFWLFKEDRVTTPQWGGVSGYDGTNFDYFLELLDRNELGFIPVKAGKILGVFSLMNAVVALGDRGISLLYPVSSPFPTFGLNELSSIGVASRNAICVTPNKDALFFVTKAGDLAVINAKDAKLEVLGYRSQLKSILHDGLVGLTYSEVERELRVSSRFYSVVYDENGLHRRNKIYFTNFMRNSEEVNIVQDVDAQEIEVITSPTDMNIMGEKTITQIALHYTRDENESTDMQLYVAVDFRYNPSQPFTRTELVPCSEAGNAFIRCQGTEFRFCIFSTSLRIAISHVTVSYQVNDKRFVRGIYASASNS